MADSTLDGDASEFHAILTDLIRVYQFRDRDCICCHDISVTQCHALDGLVRRGALTLNDLAAELYLEKSTASRVVKALEAKGYVQRSPHPEDRRAVQLESTDEGRAVHGRIEAELIEEEKRLLEDFAPEVTRSMVQLLGRIARAAAARVDTTGGRCCRIA